MHAPKINDICICTLIYIYSDFVTEELGLTGMMESRCKKAIRKLAQSGDVPSTQHQKHKLFVLLY